MGVASAIFLVIVTIFCPPIAVFAIAGCGADLLINICLTLLGYIPGHVHAFYLEYVYYDRRERLRQGSIVTDRAPGVYSSNVQNGGNPHGYGTIVQPNSS